MKTLYNWRIQYDLERDELEGNNAITHTIGETLTIQGAPDTDINEMMRRMGINDYSVLPAIDIGGIDPSYYGDFTDIPDLRAALDRVNEAKDRFQALPAKLRSRFDNNPWKLHTFVNDPENYEEAITLGLLNREPAKTEPPTPEPGT